MPCRVQQLQQTSSASLSGATMRECQERANPLSSCPGGFGGSLPVHLQVGRISPGACPSPRLTEMQDGELAWDEVLGVSPREV